MLSIVTWMLRGLRNGRELYSTSLSAGKMIGLLSIARGQEGEISCLIWHTAVLYADSNKEPEVA